MTDFILDAYQKQTDHLLCQPRQPSFHRVRRRPLPQRSAMRIAVGDILISRYETVDLLAQIVLVASPYYPQRVTKLARRLIRQPDFSVGIRSRRHSTLYDPNYDISSSIFYGHMLRPASELKAAHRLLARKAGIYEILNEGPDLIRHTKEIAEDVISTSIAYSLRSFGIEVLKLNIAGYSLEHVAGFRATYG